jgi:hypothetical protein
VRKRTGAAGATILETPCDVIQTTMCRSGLSLVSKRFACPYGTNWEITDAQASKMHTLGSAT